MEAAEMLATAVDTLATRVDTLVTPVDDLITGVDTLGTGADTPGLDVETLGTGVDTLGLGGEALVPAFDRRPSLRILGTRVDLFPSSGSVLQNLTEQSQGRQRHLCYVNAHSLNLARTDVAYKRALANADLVLNDGIGLQLAAMMRGARFPENLNGSDFTVCLLQLAADRGWRVFFYGGKPGVADAASEHLMREIDGLNVVDVCDGYSSEDPSDVILRIRAAQADVLVVALGQPKQELWLDRYLADTGCHLGLGVGAFLDFASGRVSRAPRWMNKLGVEWLFRLAQEPGRMWRRYVLGNPVFLWHAWRRRRGDQEALV